MAGSWVMGQRCCCDDNREVASVVVYTTFRNADGGLCCGDNNV